MSTKLFVATIQTIVDPVAPAQGIDALPRERSIAPDLSRDRTVNPNQVEVSAVYQLSLATETFGIVVLVAVEARVVQFRAFSGELNAFVFRAWSSEARVKRYASTAG